MVNPKAVYNSIQQLRSDIYLNAVNRLPPEKQPVKRKLYEAFAALFVLHQKGRFKEAEEVIQQILSIAPDHPEAYLTLGHVCLDLFDQPAKAAQLLSEHLRYNKKSLSSWTLLAIAYFRIDRFDESRQACNKALQIDPNCALSYLTFAQIAAAEQDFEAALSYNRKGLAIEPGNMVLLTNFGAMLQILGRKEEAERFYRKELVTHPRFYHGYYGLAKLCSFRDENDPMIGQAQKLADSDPEDAEDIGALYFGLADMYRQCKRYQDAWRYYVKAQALLLRQARYHRIQWDARLKQAVAFYTPEYFTRFASVRAKPHPSTQPIFIVGMPRSGTTLTEQILGSHSLVAAQGELRDLDIVLSQVRSLFGTKEEYPEAMLEADEALLQRMADHFYSALLKGVSSDHRFATDKKPSNFYRLGLIYRLFPGAKIIHCTRNPMDVCLSVYTNKFISTLDWTHDLTHIANYYVNYRKLMAHWEKVFPMPIHTVPYEAMVADQRGESEKLLAFLGLDWEDNCLQFHKSERAVATASTWQVRQPIYTQSVQGWRRYEKELQPFVDGIGEYAKEFLEHA